MVGTGSGVVAGAVVVAVAGAVVEFAVGIGEAVIGGVTVAGEVAGLVAVGSGVVRVMCVPP